MTWSGYIRDCCSSVTHRLKKAVTLKITPEKLAFYNIDMEHVVEPGTFETMAAVPYETVIYRSYLDRSGIDHKNKYFLRE